MTPADLLDKLVSIYPSFEKDWKIAEEWHEGVAINIGYREDPLTFQRIVSEFCVFFGLAAPSATRQQLVATAELLNAAVDMGGELESAVSTGLLEHLHQINATKYLLPHLTERAKQELNG